MLGYTSEMVLHSYNINFTDSLLLYFLLPILNYKFKHVNVQAGSAAADPLIIELLCYSHASFMNESLSYRTHVSADAAPSALL